MSKCPNNYSSCYIAVRNIKTSSMRCCVCCVCWVVNICIWPPIGIFTVHLAGIKLDPPGHQPRAHQNTEQPNKTSKHHIFKTENKARNIRRQLWIKIKYRRTSSGTWENKKKRICMFCTEKEEEKQKEWLRCFKFQCAEIVQREYYKLIEMLIFFFLLYKSMYGVGYFDIGTGVE